MDLVVNHARHQVTTLGVDNGCTLGRGDLCGDLFDSLGVDEHVGVSYGTLVYESGVGNK